MKQILQLIRNDIFQRIFYIIVLLVINIISLKNGFEPLKQNSSLGIQYYYFWIIPSIVTFWQLILNNIIGWLIFISLYIFYLAWTFYSIAKNVIFNFNEYQNTTYFAFLIIILFLLVGGYFIYLMKPKPKS